MTAYASIDDVLPLFETEPSAARQERLLSLLETASREVEAELGGLDYFRHPTNGTSTWLLDGDGSGLLHAHEGIVSVETVELSQDGGREFLEVPVEDWALQWDYASRKDPPTGEPWFHLRLLPLGTYRRFPCGEATVRLTGAAGWPQIPAPLTEGVAERARQVAFADPSYAGNIPADDAYGAPSVPVRWPHTTWNFIQRERQRFVACDL